jgi:competence protein ComEC
LRESVEAFLERERGQLPPWFVVGFGTGIAAWFALGQPRDWTAFLCVSAALALLGFSMRGGRAERAAGWFGLAMMLGCALVWARSAWVAAPRLDRPLVTEFRAKVERVETRVAKRDLRLTLAPTDPALPPRVRVSTKQDGVPEGIAKGAELQLRARLAPPPPMALPGGYDFARDAWFKGIGGVGRSHGGREGATLACQPAADERHELGLKLQPQARRREPEALHRGAGADEVGHLRRRSVDGEREMRGARDTRQEIELEPRQEGPHDGVHARHSLEATERPAHDSERERIEAD